MYRSILCALIGASLFASFAVNAEQKSGKTVDSGQLNAYTVLASPKDADRLRREHYDISSVRGSSGDSIELEIIMTESQADELAGLGFGVTQNTGQSSAPRLRSFSLSLAAPVFLPYGGPDGLQQEMRDLADQYPKITELQVIGQSGQGTDILALQVTKDAGRGKDGKKPSVLYVSAQHAREWISPEVNRRLLHYFLENYDADAEVRQIVDTTELWFVLVANPDGYDHTFTPGNRLWRKTLTDNDGDGQITGVDGVDPNRNFPSFWGYDDEGSSSNPSSATYRGTAPASEPETRAYDGLVARITPEFLVNYHSAAELLLYGVGYQVATPTPDDVILAALAGDDANPAIPGFDPDLSAELYTTNGETTEHMALTHGVLGYTPELSECQSVAPDPDTCISVFNFPDDEGLIQAEFEKNLPFALDVARSAQNPFEPISHLGNTAPDFVLDEFDQSHGNAQTVQATISRQVSKPYLYYSVNGAEARKVKTHEWEGGERYGGNFNDYYRLVRGTIDGLQTGDSVEYWFAGKLSDKSVKSPRSKKSGKVKKSQKALKGGKSMKDKNYAESDHGAFQVTAEPARVLVLVNEDYDGYTPQQGLAGPQYLFYYTDALAANGITYNTWDLDQQGTPHPLGVLAHYDAVIWYVGDNIITQDLDDRDVLFPDSEIGVNRVMQYTTIAVRDYLNEGGKLLKTGDRAGYFGQFLASFGGMLYAVNGAPDQPCTITSDVFADCLLYSDDFHQYWLGDYARQPFGDPVQVVGLSDPLGGLTVDVNGPASADNSQDAGQSVVTSSVLEPALYPAFANSRSIADYASSGTPPFAPLTGDYYAGVLADNNQYNRFSRTIDLSGATGASLGFALSHEMEGNYDFFVVEVNVVGTDQWTTLVDANGNNPPGVFLGACDDGLWNVHPFLFAHYVDAGCNPVGPTGEFHPFDGDSGGWIDVFFDLSPYAGSQIEVSLTYISDVGVSNTGVFVDDVIVTIDGVQELQGFEADQSPWAAAPPPPGSPANLTDWARSSGLVQTVIAAAVATDDTVYLPFGFEAISTAAERNEVMGRLMDYLLK